MPMQDANERLPGWLRALPATYLLVGLVWIVGSDVVLGVLLRHDLQALVYAATLKAALFVILTAVLFYIAIAARRGPRKKLAAALAPLGRGKPLAAFLVVGLGIATTGYLVYLSEVARLRDRSEEQLLATAGSAAAEVVLWREGRARSMQQVAASPFLGSSLVEWRRDESGTLGVRLEERLDDIRFINEFAGVTLASLEGHVLMANGQPIDLSMPPIRAALANSVASDRVIELPLPANEAAGQHDPQVIYIVPLKDDRLPGTRAANVLLARASLGIPLRLGELTVPSTFRTLRTELLRPDQHASNDSGDALAMRAVTREHAIFEAVDAADRRVLASSHRVAASPYFVVASIEREEIRAQLLRVMLLIGGVSALGFLAAGALVLPWWHAERMRAKGRLDVADSRADELATRFGWVMRHASDVILLLDDDGRILDANDRALELYGYTRKELLALSVFDLQPDAPAVRQSARAHFDIVRRDGSLMFEATHQRKDGTAVPVEVSSSCVTLGAQRLVQSIVRDTSQRRQAELQLRESEAKYRLLFRSNPHPMWVYDSQSLRFLAVNDAAIVQYGYGEHEFLAMTIADIRPPEDLPLLQAELRRNAGDALRNSGVWRHRRKDGSIISVEIVSNSLQFDRRAARLVLATDVTTRIGAEVALRTSEERYRHLFENASDGIVVLSSDNKILDVNAEMELLTGYTRDQLRDLKLEQLLDGREHARLEPELARQGSGAMPAPAIWIHRRRDGSTFHGEVRVRALRGDLRLATVRDLSEILAARRRIERQRDLYDLLSQCNQAIVEAGDETGLYDDLCRLAVERGHFIFACIYEIAADGEVVPGAGFGDERGCSPDELLDKDALRSRRTVIVNDYAASDSRFPAHLDGGPSPAIQAVGTFPFSAGDGVTAALTLYASEWGYFDPEICATLEEITADVAHALDSLRTRRELDHNRLLLQSIINASDALISAFDTDGRTILTNEAFARAFGGSRAALIGRTRDEMMPPDIARAHFANDQLVIGSGRSLVVEEGSVESGIERIYLSAKAPLRDAEGRIYAVGSISTDITELRRVQHQLASTNVRLEQTVEERTREAVAAQERAEAADRTKSLFLSSMSHELRSPLHSIIGFTSVLLEGLEGDLTPAQQVHLRVVADASQHLLAIINDLLDVSRIESGGISLESHPVAVRELLRRIMQRFQLQAEAKVLDLVLEEDVGERTIIGDERRIEQVVSNLVSNAIKFTSQGRVLVRCGTGDGNLRIEVIDTGSGIALQDQSQLFKYFSQVAPASGALNEGTGLGLVIARSFAEAMGGAVSVESEPGRGSTFTFILPITVDDTGMPA